MNKRLVAKELRKVARLLVADLKEDMAKYGIEQISPNSVRITDIIEKEGENGVIEKTERIYEATIDNAIKRTVPTIIRYKEKDTEYRTILYSLNPFAGRIKRVSDKQDLLFTITRNLEEGLIKELKGKSKIKGIMEGKINEMKGFVEGVKGVDLSTEETEKLKKMVDEITKMVLDMRQSDLEKREKIENRKSMLEQLKNTGGN